MINLFYVTATYPYGTGESFLEPEIDQILQNNINVFLVPRDCKGNYRKSFEKFQNDITLISKPLLGIRNILYFFKTILLHPIWFLNSLFYLLSDPNKILKNLIVFPKAVWLAKIIKNYEATHVHVHWGGTTSTMVLLACELNKTPWSLTCHRWDIYENNLLKLKSKKAKFVRFISDKGKIDACNLGVLKEKCQVIHMGVQINDINLPINRDLQIFRILCPANLIEVKGHKYLIEAAKILVNNNILNFEIHIAGEGELKKEILKLIEDNDLHSKISLLGHIQHSDLLKKLKKNNYSLVVLPSIDLGNGLHEGIPVSLMEAMSFAIPVLSTKTGSIPDLVNGLSGSLVDEKNPHQISDEIMKLINNNDYFNEKSKNGYFFVKQHFSIVKNVSKLIKLFEI